MTWLSKVLQEHSTKRYFIEYNTFLANHISHGIIALERLGATEDRTRKWIEWYRMKLEKPVEKDHTDEDYDARNVTDENLGTVTGKRKQFYSIQNYYKDKLNGLSGDINALIRQEFPKVSLGMQAALLHAAIQLGYGYAAKEECIILEGLAYLRHSNSPVIYEPGLEQNDLKHFGKGEVAITDVLQMLKSDEELHDYMVTRSKVIASGEMIASNVLHKIRAVEEKGNQLIKYANMVKIPNEITHDPARLADWIMEKVLMVYVMAEPHRKNDFVILHGVTCTWSVRQLVPILDPHDAFDALRTLLCIIFATYIGVGSPALSQPVDTTFKTDEKAWSELIATAISPDIQRDEHVYKLIQICDEYRKNADESSSALYYAASKIVLDNPFAPFDY